MGHDYLARSELTEAYSDLLVKGVYRDGSVKEYKSHKVIVCPQSTWFAVACRNGTFREGESGVITVPLGVGPDSDDGTDDGNTFHYMMQFFYTDNYTPGVDDHHPGEEGLAAHALVYAIAEKYDVAGLRELARKKYNRRLYEMWKNSEMARAISIINNSIAPEVKGLKQVTADEVARYLGRLIDDSEICDSLQLAPLFMLRVMKTMRKKNFLDKLM
ncbi:hypothetical protein MBLNU457_7680t1 [Dothideomycetes sp. NU457]